LLEKITEFFYQKFMVSCQSSTDACCRNILSNDFECKAKIRID